jgi:Holliday junction resolvase
MSNKSKGSNAERELYDMFVKNNYRAVRVAGSGRMDNADCDLIAGKSGEKYCIEAKSAKKPVKYISKEQVENFVIFSEIFGLAPVIAVRFNRLGWYFLKPEDLEDSGKNWVINQETAKQKGKRFSQFFLHDENKMENGIGFEELDCEIVEEIDIKNEEDD